MVTIEQYIDHYIKNLQEMPRGTIITVTKNSVTVKTATDNYQDLIKILEILEDNWAMILKEPDGTWTINITL